MRRIIGSSRVVARGAALARACGSRQEAEVSRGEPAQAWPEADAIIDSFLAYVHAEEESADDTVDLAEVTRLAAESAQLALAPSATTTPVWGRGNATMLQRLVTSVIDNAERHGAPPVTVEVAADATARHAVLRVGDAGPGTADPARLRRAFERGAAARGTQGAGLGLAIVDRIAERHGGSVEIASPAGGGTTVTVRLPVAPAA